MTVTVNGSSPGLSLSLDATGSANNTAVIVSGGPANSQTTNNNNNNTSTANHNHAGGGSPVDHSSLIILQPSGAAGYSSMLPSFTHYASGKSHGTVIRKTRRINVVKTLNTCDRIIYGFFTYGLIRAHAEYFTFTTESYKFRWFFSSIFSIIAFGEH